jgi:hypothetical protein
MNKNGIDTDISKINIDIIKTKLRRCTLLFIIGLLFLVRSLLLLLRIDELILAAELTVMLDHSKRSFNNKLS